MRLGDTTTVETMMSAFLIPTVYPTAENSLTSSFNPYLSTPHVGIMPPTYERITMPDGSVRERYTGTAAIAVGQGEGNAKIVLAAGAVVLGAVALAWQLSGKDKPPKSGHKKG